MNFSHYALGALERGKVVEVVLQGHAANVYLMDSLNFDRYSKGLAFQGVGGLMKTSPIRLQAPLAGSWHLVVDLPHGYGTVKVSYRLLTQKVQDAYDTIRKIRPTDAQIRAVSPDVKEVVQAVAATLSAARSQADSQIRPLPQSQSGPPVQKLRCSGCGNMAQIGKFCAKCGLALIKICPACSTEDTLGQKFCVECGYMLTT